MGESFYSHTPKIASTLGFQEPPNFQHILASGEAANIQSHQAQHKFI